MGRSVIDTCPYLCVQPGSHDTPCPPADRGRGREGPESARDRAPRASSASRSTQASSELEGGNGGTGERTGGQVQFFSVVVSLIYRHPRRTGAARIGTRIRTCTTFCAQMREVLTSRCRRPSLRQRPLSPQARPLALPGHCRRHGAWKEVRPRCHLSCCHRRWRRPGQAQRARRRLTGGRDWCAEQNSRTRLPASSRRCGASSRLRLRLQQVTALPESPSGRRRGLELDELLERGGRRRWRPVRRRELAPAELAAECQARFPRTPGHHPRVEEGDELGVLRRRRCSRGGRWGGRCRRGRASGRTLPMRLPGAAQTDAWRREERRCCPAGAETTSGQLHLWRSTTRAGIMSLARVTGAQPAGAQANGGVAAVATLLASPAGQWWQGRWLRCGTGAAQRSL